MIHRCHYNKNDLLYWPASCASGKASDFKVLAVSQLQFVRDEMEAVAVHARHYQHLQQCQHR